jgi:hypothetical protein
MTWTVFADWTLCGTDGAVIPAGQPVALLCGGKFRRCAEHAGAPVDEAQVEAERQRLEAEQAARQTVEVPLRTHSRSARDGFLPLKAVIPFDDLPEHVQRTHARAAGDGPDR